MTKINDIMEKNEVIEIKTEEVNVNREEPMQGSNLENNETNSKFNFKTTHIYCCSSDKPRNLFDVLVVALVVFTMWTIIYFMMPGL